jgi:hypothetical protein
MGMLTQALKAKSTPTNAADIFCFLRLLIYQKIRLFSVTDKNFLLNLGNILT